MKSNLEKKMDLRLKKSESYMECVKQLEACEKFIAQFKQKFPLLYSRYSTSFNHGPIQNLSLNAGGWEEEYDLEPKRFSNEIQAEIIACRNSQLRKNLYKFAHVEEVATKKAEAIKSYIARDVLRKNYNSQEAQQLVEMCLNHNSKKKQAEVTKYDKYFNEIINLFSEDIKTLQYIKNNNQ